MTTIELRVLITADHLEAEQIEADVRTRLAKMYPPHRLYIDRVLPAHTR